MPTLWMYVLVLIYGHGLATLTATHMPPTTANVTGLFTAPQALGQYRVTVATTYNTPSDTSLVLVSVVNNEVQLLFADGFESGDFKTQQNTVRWNRAARVNVVNTFSRTGLHSARFRQGDSENWSELRFTGLPQLEEVFIQFYLYQPSGDEIPSVGPRVQVLVDNKNDKFFRLWSGNYDSAPKHGASTWGKNGIGMLGTEFMINNGDRIVPMGQGGKYAQSDKHPLIANPEYLGRWIQIRIRNKVASAANNDGVIQIWVDGILASDKTDLPSYSWEGIDNYFDTGYILGWSATGFAPGQYMYVDDFSISVGGFPPQ
jgi:hypothetical protein